MANTFKDISQFTLKSAATGTEEFQVSATEKVTAQQIANKVQLSQVIMSGFSALNFTGIEKIKDSNSLLGALAILYDLLGKGNIKMVSNGSTEYGFVSMGNVSDTTHGFGWLLSISEKAIYIKNDFTSPNPSKLNNIQWVNTIKTGEKVSLDGGIKTVEITDFAIPGLNITKDGQSFFFYANDASNIPNNNHGATSFVGVAIASPIFITGDQRLLYYMMVDTAKAMFYTGCANLEDDTVTWSDTPVTRLGQAVQVTAFTESALSALLYSYKPGDFIPFYTNSVTTSADNQFPESGIFNGFISMGSNEGDYFQIFAFKTGSPKAYIGACIGSTTQWTAIGGGGAAEPIVVADAESVGTVVANAFPEFKYGKMLPIYIDPGSDIYDYISIVASNIVVDESTVCGYAQCVYDGGDYYYIGVDLLAYPGGGGAPLYRAHMVINNSGDVIDSSTFPLGIPTSPIPGYTKVNGSYKDCSLANGSTAVVTLTRSVPAGTTCFIEADVQTSITGGTIKTSSALMFFRLASGSTMCDINSRALGGAGQGQVKLKVATINSQTNFVIVTTAYNLDSSLSGGIIRIKAIYAQI